MSRDGRMGFLESLIGSSRAALRGCRSPVSTATALIWRMVVSVARSAKTRRATDNSGLGLEDFKVRGAVWAAEDRNLTRTR